MNEKEGQMIGERIEYERDEVAPWNDRVRVGNFLLSWARWERLAKSYLAKAPEKVRDLIFWDTEQCEVVRTDSPDGDDSEPLADDDQACCVVADALLASGKLAGDRPSVLLGCLLLNRLSFRDRMSLPASPLDEPEEVSDAIEVVTTYLGERLPIREHLLGQQSRSPRREPRAAR